MQICCSSQLKTTDFLTERRGLPKNRPLNRDAQFLFLFAVLVCSDFSETSVTQSTVCITNDILQPGLLKCMDLDRTSI